ncbi:MAG: phosphotransferase [Acidobacteriota bacterium]
MSDQRAIDSIQRLLAARGHGPAQAEPQPFAGNSRIYRVRAGPCDYIAKWYFSRPEDPRNRLAVEFDFLKIARTAGIDCVPEPIARDDRISVALYSALPGTPVQDVTERHVVQAIGLLEALNRSDVRGRGERLPAASEACFSLDEHVALVERRIGRLEEALRCRAHDGEARDLVDRMRFVWQSVVPRIHRELMDLGIRPTEVLTQDERCLSPSDFGLHNALEAPDGTLGFVDFEYAGWDDPAKTVNDFFCQPQVPVDWRHRELFESRFLGLFPDPPRGRRRARAMFPIFAIKWCCILLNVLEPGALERMRHANPDIDIVALRGGRLREACARLENLLLPDG